MNLRSCLLLASLFLAGCAGVRPRPPVTNDAPTVPTAGSKPASAIIDAHVHTDFEAPFTREAFIRELNEAGISGAVSHTRDNGKIGYEDLRSHGVIHCFGSRKSSPRPTRMRWIAD